jgi:MFS family permease
MFRSLGGYNYRLWAAGALISNVGTWMQRVAQTWLVLAQLTHENASAVGIVTGLQFLPLVLLLPLTGFAADHFDRRKLLILTQSGQGVLALALGLLTVSGYVQLWHVYVFALLLGCVTAFDSPARQTFVSELVGEEHLANAVALNSTSFNAGRMIGPAIAGLLIASIGTGWAFVINGISFGAALTAIAMLRSHELHASERALRTRGSLVEGFRYVWARHELKAIFCMVFLIGTFGLNFPIFISAMSVKVFHAGPGEYGILSSVLAVGTVTGALLAARRERPGVLLLIGASIVFGVGCALAAVMPNYVLFGVALVIIGIAAQTLTTSANSAVQMSIDPIMRGRVIAIFLTIAVGGTPIGAPIVGWIADAFGPRWALGVGAAAGILAAVVGLAYVVTYRRFRVRIAAGVPHISIDGGKGIATR